MQSNSTPDHFERDVPCPACGARDHTILRHDSTYQYTFVECQSCSLRYYTPRFREQYVIQTYLESDTARDEAVSMYEKGVFFGEPLEGSPEKQKQAIRVYYELMLDEQIALFRKINDREPESLFEAGCSVGWFLNAARARLSVAGCDANAYAADIGRRKLGLDIRGCTLSAYPIREGAYDLAVALDYIEHTYTPAQDLTALHRMVRPGGILLLKTFLEEHDPKGTYIHPIFHASHFFGKTLKSTLEHSGWDVIVFDEERERVYGQVTVFAKRR